MSAEDRLFKGKKTSFYKHSLSTSHLPPTDISNQISNHVKLMSWLYDTCFNHSIYYDDCMYIRVL